MLWRGRRTLCLWRRIEISTDNHSDADKEIARRVMDNEPIHLGERPNIERMILKAIFQAREDLWKMANYYDKISKQEISKEVAKRRIEIGLKNTFHIVIQSEDWNRLTQQNLKNKEGEK